MKPETVEAVWHSPEVAALAVSREVVPAVLAALTATDEYKALVADAEAHRAHMAFISPYRKEPLPDFGDRLPLRDRLPGGDGSAYWATDTHYYPRATKRPDDATQILYFSK